MNKKQNIFLLVLLLLCTALPAHAEKLIISSPPIPPVSGDAPKPGYLKDIIKEVGKRIGVDVSFAVQPAQRSLSTSNSGRTHGELHRIEGLEKNYPNLIRVPEPVLIDQFVGFAAEPGITIKDWQNTGSLRIYYPRGWNIYANAFGEDNEHHPGLHGESIFHMVAAHRIDIAMHTLDKGTYIAAQHGLKIFPVNPPFAIKPMYIYLHKSKAHLVKKMAAGIAEVKKDGTYARIKREVLFRHGLRDDAYFQSPFDKPQG